MNYLDLKIRPSNDASAGRDFVGIAILIALSVVLLPTMNIDSDRFFSDVIGLSTSCYLLPAMAMLLAMRLGIFDLSVWMNFSLGALVAAAMLKYFSPDGAPLELLPSMAAIGIAMACTAAAGAINGLLVAKSPVPSAVVTLAVAAAMWALMQIFSPAAITVSDAAFDQWHMGKQMVVELDGQVFSEVMILPLVVSRMLAVAIIFALTMLAMLMGNSHSPADKKTPQPRLIIVALSAGGALAGAGGALTLLELPSAVVPSLPIGDLILPAAALLAGALYYTGPDRTLFSAICLPFTLLLATAWQQHVWDLNWQGYSFQMLILAGAAAEVYWLAGSAIGNTNKAKKLFAALAIAGLLTLAAAGNTQNYFWHNLCHCLGLGLLIAAMLGGIRRKTVNS